MDNSSGNHHLLAELYDVQPQAIIWLRPLFSDDGEQILDFEFSYANDEGLHYLNLSREQFKGLRLSASPTVTDELREEFFHQMIWVYSTGEKSETTLFNPALNKHARVLRTRLWDGVLSVAQDITKERQIIEQLEQQAVELQEQKTLLDNIMKCSSSGISVSTVFRDETGKVIDAQTILANDAAVRFIGFPREEYVGKRATEIEPAVMDSPYYHACVKTLETGEPFVMQYQVQATGRWLELSVSKLDYNNLIHVFTDVTPIKEVQLQLEQTANTLKGVFDSAQTSMFTFIPEYNDQHEIIDFRFGMTNPSFAAYVNQVPQALEGELGSKWFPGYMTNGVFEMYKHTFETHDPQRREVHYNVDGHDIYLDLQSVRIDHQLLVSYTDHTSLRKSQMQLEQTVKALESSNKHLEEFAYAASHDLKEPIRKIITFSGRLQDVLKPKMSEAEAGLFQRIETSAKRMQLLVDDLLEFSHVSEGLQHVEPVDLNDKIVRVLSDLELPIEEKNARVELVTPLPVIYGNRRQLQQVFQNIIGNALKYSKPGVVPIITISARTANKDDEELRHFSAANGDTFHMITVTDNGIGFEQQYAEKIFEMFARLHGKAEYSGTGVGLSIVRKVMDNHGGYIRAASEQGKGAKFVLLFPEKSM